MKTFNTYLYAQDKSKVTVSMIEQEVCKFCNWSQDQGIEARRATYNELLSYIQYLQKKQLSQRTIQMIAGHLKHYFKWLMEIGVRLDNPLLEINIHGVKRKILYHIIPMADLEKIYAQINGNHSFLNGSNRNQDRQNHYSRKTFKAMYGLMIWQGCGASELTNLRVQDLKLREGKIHIAGDRRSNERTLKLEAVQILDLMEYLQVIRPALEKRCPIPGDQLFIAHKSQSNSSSRIYYIMQLVKTLNPRITQYKQIHASVITHWLKNHNLRQVQYMAGHRYVSSTEAYLINDLDDLKEDINKFHPLG